jgi:Outer membrane cytochrome MtrC/MtrF-like, domains II/IV
MKNLARVLMFVMLTAIVGLGLVGCADDGSNGTNGASAFEIAVANGFTGTEAEWLASLQGQDAVAVGTQEACSVCHGLSPNLGTGALEERPFSVATYMDVNDYTPVYGVEITNVALTTGGAGGMVIDFTVTDETGAGVALPLDGNGNPSSVKMNLSKLVQQTINTNPATIFTWQNYTNLSKTEDGPGFFGAGAAVGTTSVIQADGVNCTMTDGALLGDFTCTVATDFTTVTTPIPVTFEPALTHRVAVFFGSHPTVGQPGNGWVDIIPQTLIDGGTLAAAQAAVVDTRDIATTASCNECHGILHGHGGDRVEVAICVTCHNPGTSDPDSGLSMDMAAMIHSIHLGNDAGSTVAVGAAHPAIVGGFNEDGAILRATDYIVGHRGSDNNFSEITFPGRLDDCQKCHTAADIETPDGDNPLNAPSKLACVSCHDETAWNATHSGRNDSTCLTCHSGQFSVAATHEFTTTEFVTTITMDAPANGTHYVTGEAPLITVTVADGTGTDVGGYTTADFNSTSNPTGVYNDGSIYIYGPRSKSAPVLATGTMQDPAFVAALALDDTLTPSQGHSMQLSATGTNSDPQVLTDATGFKYQTLAVTDDMTPGTYMVLARVGVGSSSSERAWALTNIQIGTATEQLKVTGGGTRDALNAPGCESCHYLADYSSTAHRAFFGTDGCLACHDQSGNHADPLANRVHAVHAASSAGDLVVSREFSEVTYPQNANHCKACHTSGNTSFRTNPLGFACVGCHGDATDAKDHMVQMGANFTESFLTEEP